MTIDCIAIEDEPLALKKVTGFINEIDFLNLAGCFNNAIQVLNHFNIFRQYQIFAFIP